MYTSPNDPLAGNNLSIDESVNDFIQQGAETNKSNLTYSGKGAKSFRLRENMKKQLDQFDLTGHLNPYPY
ncbi:hypothetical protein M3661_25765 [Paenibacillus sp. MER 180]|uniref:hypothetical protein n=1 Tax=Paenibacillus sp. MER 180 TaxID=2939570 RepID=UPI00203BE953|nr:hypothetical protein [Paenibacillus sp. MER 180]MCM3293516.1 hypothetical protein [Paenibacillus sp. MER 180]